MQPRKLTSLALVFILAMATPVLLTACDGSNIGSGGVISSDTSCRYNDSLSETADSFISRCRQGRIRREFPTAFNNVTLRAIKADKSDDGKKAYKLLNDGRFKK